MTFCFSALGWVVVKFLAVSIVAGPLAVLFLWPANEQPTTLGQKISYILVMTLITMMTFTSWLSFTN